MRSRRSVVVSMAVGSGLLLGVVPIATLSSAAAAPATRHGSANPPGNNGTIKIDQIALDPGDQGGHDNDPHVSCAFDLQVFGYDAGTQTLVADFTAQPPSGHGQPVTPLQGRPVFPFQGTGAGNHLDATEPYALDVTGLTQQPKQGYHIKLTVHVTGSQGADVKHKVFWYQPCVAAAPSIPPTVTESPTPTPTPTPTVTVTVTPTVGATEGTTETLSPTQGSTVLATQTSVAPASELSSPATVVEGEHITRNTSVTRRTPATHVLGVKVRYPRAVQAGDGGLLARGAVMDRHGAYLVGGGAALLVLTAFPWRRCPRRVRRHAR